MKNFQPVWIKMLGSHLWERKKNKKNKKGPQFCFTWPNVNTSSKAMLSTYILYKVVHLLCIVFLIHHFVWNLYKSTTLSIRPEDINFTKSTNILSFWVTIVFWYFLTERPQVLGGGKPPPNNFNQWCVSIVFEVQGVLWKHYKTMHFVILYHPHYVNNY